MSSIDAYIEMFDQTKDGYDIQLSQICAEIEDRHAIFEGFECMSLTQTIQKYNLIDGDTGNEMYGDFTLQPDEKEQLSENLGKDFPKESISLEEAEKRFANPLSDAEIQALISNQENVNTKKNTAWSYGVFQSWCQHRTVSGIQPSPPDLKDMSSDELNFFLGKFVLEARRKDGQPYPPRSLYLIVCGLLRYLRDSKVYDAGKNFLDPKNLLFSEFRKILDARMKQLLSDGVGTRLKQADPILPADEEILWNKEVFGRSSALSLQHTMFFYACKLFALRGLDEHRALQCEQFNVGEDHNGKFITFTGRDNKTYKGGLRQMEIPNKQIKQYCENGERCIADLMREYLDALGCTGPFYRKALSGQPIRYGRQPVGVNTLGKMTKAICNKGGLQGNYSNHSGKRTCATQLYLAGIDEQEIMARTGHRSEKGVRKYKRSGPDIQKQVCAVLNPPACKAMKFDEETKECVADISKMEFMQTEPECAIANTSNTNGPSTSTSSSTARLTNEISNMKHGPIFNNCTFNFK